MADIAHDVWVNSKLTHTILQKKTSNIKQGKSQAGNIHSKEKKEKLK